MKKITFFSALFITAIIAFTSCTKDGTTGPAGAQGPIGPQGPAGAQGPAGPQGVAGNANVVTYTYGTQTFTGSKDYLLTNISQARIDSSFVLAYYNPSTEAATAWYPIPGIGSTGAYDTRFFIYQSATTPVSAYTMGVRLMIPGSSAAYAGSVTFTKFKIVVVASSIITAGGRQIQIDWSDYNAVKKYLNLPE